MQKLPELPGAVRVLTKEESERLDSLYPSLPKSLAQCPTCYGEKQFRWYAEYGVDDNIVDYECPCADQFILFKYFLNAGVGKQGQVVHLADATGVDTVALEMISDYIENAHYYVNRGMGLLFHGNAGTGKTFLATLLMKQLLAYSGVDGYFTTFNQFLDNFAAGWRDDNNRLWFEKRVRNAPLLIVDDIGKEYFGRTDMAASAIDTVFRTRTQNLLPTIVTTNLSLEAFKKSYSSGVMSLLSETALTHEFTGADWRKNQADRNREEARLRLTRPIVVS
jgi:DNA replication protein DnaC